MKTAITLFCFLFLLSCRHDDCKEKIGRESRRADSLQAILIIERETGYRIKPQNDFYYLKMQKEIMTQIKNLETKDLQLNQ